jgi:hypothetical protein
LTQTFLSSKEAFSNRKSIVLFFLFVHLDRVVFKIKKHLNFTISFVFMIAFDDWLLEVPMKSQNMSVKMNPIRLIQLRSVSVGIFGIEMFMSGRKVGLVDVGRFSVFGLTW